MTIPTLGPVDPELASWNDRMYEAHPTPYGGGIAGRIEAARVRAVLDLAAIGPGDRVLEVGCESGRLLAAVPPCRRLVGVDISRRALEDARARLGPRDVELFQVDALRGLPFERGAFDVILCSEMLEHVSEPERVVANIHAVCAPTSRVVVSVPIEAPKVLVKSVLARLGLLERLFPGIEPAQSEWHVHAFSPAMLRRVVTERFTIERTKRVIAAHEVASLRAR